LCASRGTKGPRYLASPPINNLRTTPPSGRISFIGSPDILVDTTRLDSLPPRKHTSAANKSCARRITASCWTAAANWQGEGLSNMPIFRIRMAHDAFAAVCRRSKDLQRADLRSAVVGNDVDAPGLQNVIFPTHPLTPTPRAKREFMTRIHDPDGELRCRSLCRRCGRRSHRA